MNFIKNHYEKVLLGFVLIALTVAVALLPFKIAQEKKDLKEKQDTVLRLPNAALSNLDDSTYLGSVQRLAKNPKFDFARPHNVFNPVPWQKKPDGGLIPLKTGSEIGPDALTVTNIHPLYTIFAFETVGASGSNYLVSVTREAELKPANRRKRSIFMESGIKNEFATVLNVKIRPEALDKPELTLKLNDSGESVVISADKPYRRVDGYSADLKYDPEKKAWNYRRSGDKLAFAGDEFTVATINQVATNQFEVIVSARSTQKKFIRPFSGEVAP